MNDRGWTEEKPGGLAKFSSTGRSSAASSLLQSRLAVVSSCTAARLRALHRFQTCRTVLLRRGTEFLELIGALQRLVRNVRFVRGWADGSPAGAQVLPVVGNFINIGLATSNLLSFVLGRPCLNDRPSPIPFQHGSGDSGFFCTTGLRVQNDDQPSRRHVFVRNGRAEIGAANLLNHPENVRATLQYCTCSLVGHCGHRRRS